MMKRARKVVGIFVILTVFLIYVIWDNNRITVDEQEVMINDLPEQFAGLSILQISDLHEKVFGKDQKRLLKVINSLDYDVIVFTGGMLDYPESVNYKPFYTLLEGIENKKYAFFVQGNSDPASYQMEPTFEKSEFIKKMEERGVQLLESVETINIDGIKVHFANMELSMVENPEYIGRVQGTDRPIYSDSLQYQTYQKPLWREMQNLDFSMKSEIFIGLSHYPIPDVRIDYIKDDVNIGWREYELMIAGHYHGGQIRLPFIGALFIPDPWYDPNGFFPPENRVKGLWESNGTKQYVSTGLGSSDAISFLDFRLFNPPEVNLIKVMR